MRHHQDVLDTKTMSPFENTVELSEKKTLNDRQTAAKLVPLEDHNAAENEIFVASGANWR